MEIGEYLMILRTLTEKERDLLIYCLKVYKPKLVDQISAMESGNMDSDTVDEMRDAVGLEIMAKGFLKGDSKSHDYGMELEALIDRIADLYLWTDKK
jgi:hypothetical protein